VVATQNPLDFHGTYPLPEVQLDRFAMKLSLGYAARDAELEVMARSRTSGGAVVIEPVMSMTQFRELVDVAASIGVAEPLLQYVADLVGATRTHRDLRLGVSTRGTLTLLAVARASALSHGRGYVTPDDIKEVAIPVLAHRVAVSPEAEIDGVTEMSIIEGVLGSIPVPRAREAGNG